MASNFFDEIRLACDIDAEAGHRHDPPGSRRGGSRSDLETQRLENSHDIGVGTDRPRRCAIRAARR
jgi:hypothetical protein